MIAPGTLQNGRLVRAAKFIGPISNGGRFTGLLAMALLGSLGMLPLHHAAAQEVGGERTPNPEVKEDPLLENFMDLRRSLAASRQQAMENAGTETERRQAMQQWREANAAQHEQMRDLARQLGERSAAERPQRELPPLEVYMERFPEDMSPAMRELMEERYAMRQARDSAGIDEPGLSEEQRRDRMSQVREQNTQRMERIRTLSDQVAKESEAQRVPRELPPLEVYMQRLPEDASPAMRDLMEERYLLRQARQQVGVDEPGLSDEARMQRRQQVAQDQSQRMERIRQLSEQVAEEGRLEEAGDQRP